ncbi:hypothetical protein JCGZ_09589 [Jatropha curcas]|uniref:MYB family protein n=1 Tax=Jatropha curcas TaxID=180498 RepID=A0A067LKV6_JATCU|nr:transcription factor WER [Jatropha curcas]AIT52271.1 MYB family protein [Jatropha curcas]KDP45340.1 hypothetical protein JCGZ_09589 [Jatropha curcas]
MEPQNQYKKGLWTEEEDKILMDYVNLHGKGKWNHISKKTGLKRCGKSCRLRWLNYLSPNVKRGNFTEEEEDLIIRLHNLLGNRWSLIAKRVPGRTDNQVKNYWNTHLTKKLVTTKDENGRLINTRTSIVAASVSTSSNSSKECLNTEITHQDQVSDTHQEIMFKDSTCASPFWFFDDAIANEFLDGYSFDNFAWN